MTMAQRCLSQLGKQYLMDSSRQLLLAHSSLQFVIALVFDMAGSSQFSMTLYNVSYIGIVAMVSVYMKAPSDKAQSSERSHVSESPLGPGGASQTSGSRSRVFGNLFQR